MQQRHSVQVNGYIMSIFCVTFVSIIVTFARALELGNMVEPHGDSPMQLYMKQAATSLFHLNKGQVTIEQEQKKAAEEIGDIQRLQLSIQQNVREASASVQTSMQEYSAQEMDAIAGLRPLLGTLHSAATDHRQQLGDLTAMVDHLHRILQHQGSRLDDIESLLPRLLEIPSRLLQELNLPFHLGKTKIDMQQTVAQVGRHLDNKIASLQSYISSVVDQKFQQYIPFCK